MIKTDVIIIGGGATGCGVARDLALRGIPHCLIEKGDFSAPKQIAIAICACPAMKACAAAGGTPRWIASSSDAFIRAAAVATTISDIAGSRKANCSAVTRCA